MFGGFQPTAFQIDAYQNTSVETVVPEVVQTGAGGPGGYRKRRRYILPDNTHVMATDAEIAMLLRDWQQMARSMPPVQKTKQRNYVVEGEAFEALPPIEPPARSEIRLAEVKPGLPDAITVEQLRKRLKKRMEEEWLISILLH